MSNQYIDNEEFERIILSYQAEPDVYEEELVALFDLLITNIINSFRFKIDPDDAKQDCFTLVLKTVANFKPRKGTAFNYFTTVVVNNMKLMYTREKRYQQKIDNFMETKRDFL